MIEGLSFVDLLTKKDAANMERDDIDFPNLRLDPINRIRPGHWKIPFPIGHQVTLDRALIDCSMSRGS